MANTCMASTGTLDPSSCLTAGGPGPWCFRPHETPGGGRDSFKVTKLKRSSASAGLGIFGCSPSSPPLKTSPPLKPNAETQHAAAQDGPPAQALQQDALEEAPRGKRPGDQGSDRTPSGAAAESTRASRQRLQRARRCPSLSVSGNFTK